MARCKKCDEKIGYFTEVNGFCEKCFKLHQAEQQGQSSEQIIDAENEKKAIHAKTMNMLVTTEMFCPDLKIIERKGIVSAEVVVGMNVFKDLFAGIRNIVGGRSEVIQDALRDIRIQVIDELKMEAARSGANAVIAVDLDYQDIGATGSTMLMLVASGTAVVVED